MNDNDRLRQIADAARDAHEIYQMMSQMPPTEMRDLIDRNLIELRDRLLLLAKRD